MYFPWCGLLDQIRLADFFVHYDDVQLARGFYNRVQVKTPQGARFITVPIKNKHQKDRIDESVIDYTGDWVNQHRTILINAYSKSKYFEDVIHLFDSLHAKKFEVLGNLTRESIKSLAAYFNLNDDVIFLESKTLNVNGSGSKRLLDITKHIGGDIYLTGHGAINYLDHQLFEDEGIEVRYIDYNIRSYEQFYGNFTPYVTSLDAVAHNGPNSYGLLDSTTVNWREAIERFKKI